MFVSCKALVKSAEGVNFVVFSPACGLILTAINKTWHIRLTNSAIRHRNAGTKQVPPIIPRGYRGTFSFLQLPQYDQLRLQGAEIEATTQQHKTTAKCSPTLSKMCMRVSVYYYYYYFFSTVPGNWVNFPVENTLKLSICGRKFKCVH